MIAISFALPEESKGLVALLARRARQGAGPLPTITGWLGAKEVAIVHTGMGRVSAAGQLERFFAERKPALLIAAGFGGALAPELQGADLVVGANYSDAGLVAKMGALIERCRRGTLVTADEVIETRAAKAELAGRTGAICVDMETDEIARQCGLRHIPMLAVRAISDTAGEDLPVPARVWFDAARQRPRPAGLVGHLLLHPGKIAPFARFVRGINPARAALTRFLVEAVAILEG